MIEKWVLILMFVSPHVTTSDHIEITTKDLCECAAESLMQDFNRRNDKVELTAYCIQASRHTPEDRMED